VSSAVVRAIAPVAASSATAASATGTIKSVFLNLTKTLLFAFPKGDSDSGIAPEYRKKKGDFSPPFSDFRTNFFRLVRYAAT
jgi:hypothetical protein